MTFYEDLVVKTQQSYSRYYNVYARGLTPYRLSEKKAQYDDGIKQLIDALKWADCIVVGGASGLSAAGGGDFYYSDTPSYKEYFAPFYKKYGFKGAFAGMGHQFESREEFWGYVATFLHTTQTAPIRRPYLDLASLLEGKDFHVITTNQDTQFVKLYPEEKVSQIQGDHRFFQCSVCCHDEVWDATEPVSRMIEAMNGGTSIPSSLIPRCPKCGEEAFPWVRGYGNLLEGERYESEYRKASEYITSHWNKKVLFLELGVGRLTPMFIQEPFWNLAYSMPDARYISINDRYDFLPVEIEDKGIAFISDIAKALDDAKKALEKSDERLCI